MVILTEDEIADLIAQPKSLPPSLEWPPKMKLRRGHRQGSLEVVGTSGTEFCVNLRQSEINAVDFSIILGYRLPGTYTIFRLRRYNGKSHWHSNPIERQDPFFDFHIHKATERYQELGADEEHFAEVTTAYADFDGALEHMLKECGFEQRKIEGPLFK